MRKLLSVILLLSSACFAQSVGSIFFETSYTRTLGTVATPAFDNDTGSYPGTVTVTITDTTSGAAIKYCTTSGCDPSAGSAYSTPVTFTGAGTYYLRAIATKSGYTDSAIKSATYTVTASGATWPGSDDFNRANGAVGTNWLTTSFTQGTYVAPVIVSNQLVQNTAYKDGALLWNAATPNDQWIQATLVSGTVVMLVRADDTAHTAYMYKNNGATHNLSRVTSAAGAATFITNCTAATAGQVIKFAAVGTTLTVTANGTTICTTTDATLASGKVGVWLGAGATLPGDIIDDVSVGP